MPVPPAVRHRPRSEVVIPVVALAVAGTVGALAVSPAPTAWGPADSILTALIGPGTVAVGYASRRRWIWLVVTAVGAAGAVGEWPVVVGASLLLVVAAVAHRWDRGGGLVGALLGAGLLQVLLRMPRDRTALNAAVAAVALGLLGWDAWRSSSAETRARVRRAARPLGAAVAAAAGAALLALLMALPDLARGVDRAEAGLDTARDGSGAEAAEQLASAASDLGDAHARLDGWWARPALALPVLGPQVRALAGLAEEGSHLAAAGASALREAGLDDLRVVDGRIDLDQVRSMEDPLTQVRADLEASLSGLEAVGSPWLAGPVAWGLDSFERSVLAASRDAATASQAVEVLPDLLGGGGERRYLVAFGTPAETRELGGFMGAYAILGARDGDLELIESDRVLALNRAFKGSRLSDPERFPPSYLAMLPQRFWHNSTATPDFPTMAAAIGQLHRPPRAEALDGVLYMDPHTLAAMLRLTGPIRVDGRDEPLTARNAADFLLKGQYTEFPGDDRHEFLVDTAEQVFDELTSGTLPEPGEVAEALASSVAGRRLLVHSFHPDEQALLERLGLDGALPHPRGDLLTVRTQNRGLNKIDAFLRREIRYEVAPHPSGSGVAARLTVTLHNDAPASGLPRSIIGNRLGEPDGTSSTTLAVYSPLKLEAVTEGADALGVATTEELGLHRHAVLLDLPPGSSRTVVFELAGSLPGADAYHLDVIPQPLATPDRLTVVLDLPWGGQVTPIDDRRHGRTLSIDRR